MVRYQNKVSKYLIHSALQTQTDNFANSKDPDETAGNKQSHQDLHCLPFCFCFLLNLLSIRMDISKFKEGTVYFRTSGVKGLKLICYDLLWAKKLMIVPLNPASDAISLNGDSNGSSSSGLYSPGTSPADRRLLISSRNTGSTNWWSSSNKTTCSPSIPACCIT